MANPIVSFGETGSEMVQGAYGAIAQTSGAGQSLEIDEGADMESADVGSDIAFIAVVESRTFLRECIRRSMQQAFSVPVVTYSALSEFERQRRDASTGVVILSVIEAGAEASALKRLSQFAPRWPVVVLASKSDAAIARIAIEEGAKGYIPVTMGFEIAVEAVRFVMAGGTYAPMDCLLAPDRPARPASPSGVLTARELSVVRAIQRGKSNKIIAYDLNMCESTVKVHLRNIMRKLQARNRTEVAIKAQAAEREAPQ